MKYSLLIVLFFVIYFSDAQITTFTLNGGVPSTTLTAPLNNGSKLFLKQGNMPANYKVKIVGYYYGTFFFTCNTILFNVLNNINYNSHFIINTNSAPSCTISLATNMVTEMDMVAYDAQDIPQWRWYIFNSIPTSLAEVEENLPITIYPNPATDQINIEADEQFSERFTVNLYNSIGQLVLTETFPQSQEPMTLNVENLDKGIYSLQLISNSRRAIKKIVKE